MANFKNDLDFSETEDKVAKIKEILKKEFNAEKVTKNEVKGDDLGVDYYVYANGVEICVDVKVRRCKATDYQDVALETCSNVSTGKVGWTLNESSKTEYVLWLWSDYNYFICPFRELRENFSRDYRTWIAIGLYKVTEQRTGNYLSQCIFVPVSTICLLQELPVPSWAKLY